MNNHVPQGFGLARAKRALRDPETVETVTEARRPSMHDESSSHETTAMRVEAETITIDNGDTNAMILGIDLRSRTSAHPNNGEATMYHSDAWECGRQWTTSDIDFARDDDYTATFHYCSLQYSR